MSTPAQDVAAQDHFVQIETPKPDADTSFVSSDTPKFTLQWRYLSLKATVINPRTKQAEEKVILSNVSGTAKPGELLVIMGPSGAGKSSLLDCISGRNKAVEGEIVLNGQPWSDATKRLASYVMQDDLFYQTITVKEHLVFQAKLRMGKTYTEQQYMKRVDELYLLSDGSPVYQGKALESVDYFASLGYACPSLMNPTDYFMKQLVVMDKATDADGVARVDKLKKEWSQCQTMPQLKSPDGDMKVEDFQDSRLNFFGQIGVLAHRNVVRFVRDRLGFRAAIFQTLFISLIVGLIYLQLELDQKGIQNFTGGFFFLIVNQTFGSANPVFVSVPMELPIIIREYRAGLYHLFSWYLSKNVSEIPMQILLPIVFFVPAYFLIGIGHGFDVYIYQQIIMILVNSCAVGLGYMVSCLVRRIDIAPIIGMIIILPFLLFGGLLINSDDCPKYFVWIQYVSPIKYGFEAIMKIFWEQVPKIACDEAIENCTAHTGADVLKNYSLQSRTALGDGFILLAINVGFRTIGFVGLWLNLRKEG
ncbi:hypothetical protein PC129_g20283 [Phytophthora cactorum]|uniref:ABC transporter domain-containing protein n=1 Tax=Phytophthora cactorum TaxID=29920 RepID=A0A8T1H8P8_9STRA|nr:hypothetical protein PC115_g16852 [Phytophthora cactorum]KAG2966452.1 hypothetical protein PC118_g19170 [Phytophthora cactorum]KAG3006718.1 hypothetical protein PC120_g17184 [Phytophthora cactorum]KAG3147582.1 hypothetical protein PC128_g23759 [Phytophthora cactorum]KAG3208694.1 hypothetical protein PC129_g20283 [Phytophthora cactorum]